MAARQTKVQIFRNNATDQDWEALQNFYTSAEGSPDKKGQAFRDEYGFSYASVKEDLEERGLIEIKRKKKGEDPEFIIRADDLDSGPLKSRTVTAAESVFERLDRLTSDHPQYNKRAIFEKLISEALEKYGY